MQLERHDSAHSGTHSGTDCGSDAGTGLRGSERRGIRGPERGCIRRRQRRRERRSERGGRRARVHDGPGHDDGLRQAHDRHGQPGVSAVLPAPASGNAPKPWELGDPTNGEGFESAVAYAVADKLGFAKSDVVWTVVPFSNSYKPGTKPFDFYLAQVSYTADRAKAVDMSDGYYFVAQSVVALKDNPIAKVTSIAGLKSFRFGAQAGTTAYDTIQNVIAPTAAAKVYDSNDTAIQALKSKQIDAIVVDLPTAFYMTAAQLVDAKGNGIATIVGQFPVTPGPDAEHFSLVLGKGSALTTCVNQAIAALKADGTLDQITKEWLSDKASAPILQP